MFTLIGLVQEVGAGMAHADLVAAPNPGGGGGSSGILDWLTTKLGDVQSLFRLLSLVGGMGFVIYQAIASRGALARIVIAGLAAAVFIWIVWNVTALKTRVNDEFNGASAASVTQLVGPAAERPPAGRAAA